MMLLMCLHGLKVEKTTEKRRTLTDFRKLLNTYTQYLANA